MSMRRLTVAQALVAFLDQQYVVFDGVETKFVESIFTIMGHGIAVGLGEALDAPGCRLRVLQGRNEQGMCHAAIGFAKQSGRRRIIPCASSIGPGALNMVTAAATATANNVPLLVLPADTFATRQPDPVLQQIEQPHDLTITANDAFRPVCRFWDRITRPEQLMSALLGAMRVLTDPAATGAVCIALPQDTEGEAYDYPDRLFARRVTRITRPIAVADEIAQATSAIARASRPLVIVGGGVRFSRAGAAVEEFCGRFGIPFAETQGGKSACVSGHPCCVGGIGTTGTRAANRIAQRADCVIAIGTRLSDFTTASKWLFQNPQVRIVAVNISRFHATKMDAIPVAGDARASIEVLGSSLGAQGYRAEYGREIARARAAWATESKRLGTLAYGTGFEPLVDARDPRTIPEFVELTGGVITQTAAIRIIRDEIAQDAVIITAGGSLPSDLQRLWTTEVRDTYHAEYAFSCMGYECAAALGAKLAEPEREVYALVGDGSFQMLHSEMATAVQERVKIHIIVFDNCGFGCINNLEMSHGIGSLATEFRFREPDAELAGGPAGELIAVDYAKIGEGFGFATYTARTPAELVCALRRAREQPLPALIDVKVLPKTMTEGYDAWWNVGLAEVSENERVRKSWEQEVRPGRERARRY